MSVRATSVIRSIAKRVIPKAVRDWRWQRIQAHRKATLDALPVSERFNQIYTTGMWGRDESGAMSSGNGSRDEVIVGPYIAAMTALLTSLGGNVRLVDIGAGDFGVGSRLAPFVDHYTACDISSAIIEQNKRRFAAMANVQFVVLDAANSPLPSGDIVTIRQVFQHLSNDQIGAIVRKLAAFRYIVVTEVVPEPGFPENIDHPAGDTIRHGSGVDIAMPPFGLEFTDSRILCEVENTTRSVGGLIRTTLYIREPDA